MVSRATTRYRSLQACSSAAFYRTCGSPPFTETVAVAPSTEPAVVPPSTEPVVVPPSMEPAVVPPTETMVVPSSVKINFQFPGWFSDKKCATPGCSCGGLY